MSALSPELQTILEKIGLTASETETLFEHFVADYIKNKCHLSIALSTSVSHETYSKYLKVQAEVEISDSRGVLISDKVYDTISTSELEP